MSFELYSQSQTHFVPSLYEDKKTYGKLNINLKRNIKGDQTENIDNAAASFKYQECKDEYWNPLEFSLMYGTPLWEGATDNQKLHLNHMYWVAYYSQIISAEIATILFNQTSAAGLNSMEGFRLVCDTLDLESAQERSHINAFKTIGEAVERELFNDRIFTYPMRSAFSQTMICAQTNWVKNFWRNIQLRYYTQLSAGNSFIACQYFTVRGLRTLNGKIVQHKLSQYYSNHASPEVAPIPAKVSFYHFLDESYHFNSSTIISHDVIHHIPKPTALEKMVANMTLKGCQKDHYHFSTAINGIFWYDPAVFGRIFQLLLSPIFSMERKEAKEMLWKCFAEENESMHSSYATHKEAIESYKCYVADLSYVTKVNRDMEIMSKNSLDKHLQHNRNELKTFLKSL